MTIEECNERAAEIRAESDNGDTAYAARLQGDLALDVLRYALEPKTRGNGPSVEALAKLVLEAL